VRTTLRRKKGERRKNDNKTRKISSKKIFSAFLSFVHDEYRSLHDATQAAAAAAAGVTRHVQAMMTQKEKC